MSTIEKAVNKQKQQAKPVAEDKDTIVDRVQAVEASSDIESSQADSAQVTSLEVKHASLNQPETIESSSASTSRTTVSIDLAELERKNFVSLSSERRLINEEYRVIKRKLINNAFGGLSSTLKHPNLILVSSSRPGEGKTFSAINLALSIALEQDKTVLLVDSDVLRPNVSKTLNLKHEIGLTDYLQSDQIKVSDIILNTNIERLKIVTAGSPHHLSTELLASERMSMLVDEFASRYSDRIVIFDAPPLLGVNETSVMASMCGQAVIVVEENHSKLSEIEQAVSLLPKDIAVGFLINKAHRNQGKGYGYGYYYGAD
ncbi:XrtA-associated tyrosine autokinase [Rheinheimera sp. WS51]|uniref:XrtA-associated tyrosine autokinase n=1 Tax=Rheinheimera sp. WS51 TaxID=3425886 RepID=UPI003D905871